MSDLNKTNTRVDFRSTIPGSFNILRTISSAQAPTFYHILYLFYSFVKSEGSSLGFSTIFTACTCKVFELYRINISSQLIVTRLCFQESFRAFFSLIDLYKCKLIVDDYLCHNELPNVIDNFEIFEYNDVVKFFDVFLLNERFYNLNCEEIFFFFIRLRCRFVRFHSEREREYDMIAHYRLYQ